jgi:hypothetical protein
MKVGALEESRDGLGRSPVVDVQTTVTSQVLNREVLDAGADRPNGADRRGPRAGRRPWAHRTCADRTA